MMLKMVALALAPRGVLQKRKFFRPQYWIILTVIRSLYDHTAAAGRLERERSAKFTVTLVRPAIKSHSKIPGC
jgi:hypothetical protein